MLDSTSLPKAADRLARIFKKKAEARLIVLPSRKWKLRERAEDANRGCGAQARDLTLDDEGVFLNVVGKF